METILSYYDPVLSHPQSTLKRHLHDVAELGVQSIPNFNGSLLSTTEYTELCRLSCLLHDAGKATSFFQEYIRNPQNSNVPKDLKSHALISAVIAFGILEKMYPTKPLISLIGFLCIRRHHGNLENIEECLLLTPSDESLMQRQINAIPFEILRNIIGNVEFLEAELCLSALIKISNLSIDLFDLLDEHEIQKTYEGYFLINTLFSTLIFADKTDAITSGDNQRLGPLNIDSHDVLSYINMLSANSEHTLNNTRNNILSEIRHSLTQLTDDQAILSINAPTGSGKTLTAIHAALYLKERFNLERIIYCLPFTSIIDQNFDVITKVFEHCNQHLDSTQLIMHHHLSETNYTREHENYEANIALHHIETWESRIIVTTFVQIFETLISGKNRSLRKFHKLSNAVLLLDEIQSLPHKYWLLCNQILKELSKRLNVKIILLTATMPLIFNESTKEIIELLPNKRTYFQQLSRIQLDCRSLNNGDISWPNFLKEMDVLCIENPQKSKLIVVNTIRSARELYTFLQQQGHNHLLYLSSHITPFERKKRIQEIQHFQHNGIPVTVVSTQLIEAGVDIDMDIVIRDFAPLDNIFQTAGRCNRNGSHDEPGIVKLYSIDSVDGFKPQSIYDDRLRQYTRSVLANQDIIDEADFFTFAQAYFTLVSDYDQCQESIDILNNIRNQNWEALEQFSVIPKTNFTMPLFIELDEQASEALQEYQDAQRQPKSFNKRIALKQAAQRMALYTIQIPSKNLPNNTEGIYILSQASLPQYYSREIGYLGTPIEPTNTAIIL